MPLPFIDPEAARAALDLLEQMMTGPACAGCEVALDDIEAMNPERRRRVVHEFTSMAMAFVVTGAAHAQQHPLKYLRGLVAAVPDSQN